MKLNFKTFSTAVLFGALVVTNANAAMTTKTTAPNTGEAIVSSEEMTATVKDINYKTRQVTLQMDDGEVQKIVASDDIRNFNQIKKGDLVTANYTEAVVYNINKGGKASPAVVTETASRARPGSMPAASAAREVTATVIVSEIDRKAPSVTFKRADGDTQTFKVKHPEKLNGVNVGDAIDITYSEALALKVEKKAKQ
jgi:Cu/Ag efflux protein CusF